MPIRITIKLSGANQRRGASIVAKAELQEVLSNVDMVDDETCEILRLDKPR